MSQLCRLWRLVSRAPVIYYHAAARAGAGCDTKQRRRAAVSNPDQLKSMLVSMLSKLPQEDMAHFVDAANRPENANMTPEQLLGMLVSDPRNAQLLTQVQQQLQSG